jgi:hypothetical protein
LLSVIVEVLKVALNPFLGAAKNGKIQVNFFRLRRSALTRATNGAKFIAICGLIRELWAFK